MQFRFIAFLDGIQKRNDATMLQEIEAASESFIGSMGKVCPSNDSKITSKPAEIQISLHAFHHLCRPHFKTS
jgi:hypothetical protein